MSETDGQQRKLAPPSTDSGGANFPWQRLPFVVALAHRGRRPYQYAVPALSWLKQSMVFLLLATVFVVGIGMAFWLNYGRVAAPDNSRDQVGA